MANPSGFSTASSTASAPASAGVTEGRRIRAWAQERSGSSHQSRSNSLIEVLARVFSSTRLTITAQ